jgi:teichuronic acid biosynthesis glycosyltransferase TuaC
LTEVIVVTTSYPEHLADAQGHFVAAEVRRLTSHGPVTVLAPGPNRQALGAEQLVGLQGAAAFGFPGALARLRQRPSRAWDAARFTNGALRWLRSAPAPDRLIGHFLVPCGTPIATRGLRSSHTELEVVVHGSDARLFAQLPGRSLLGRELIRSGAHLRFVSNELVATVLGALAPPQRRLLEARSRVEACLIDVEHVPDRVTARRGLGIDECARVAVIVARLVPQKRVEVALEACGRVPNLAAIVVGDGPERAGLERRFPRARFVGHVARPEALAYVAAANVLVSASLLEGAPTVVREARALGTDVVCLAAGDLRKWASADPGIHVVD